METLINIFAPVVLAWLIIREWQLPQRFKNAFYRGLPTLDRNLIRLKPFDCEPCLSFWLSIVQAYAVTGQAYTAFCTGLLSYGVALIVTKQ